MGDRDLLKPLLERKGVVHFGRVLMKPGKPLTFATLELAEAGRKLLVFGLPGDFSVAAAAAARESQLNMPGALRRSQEIFNCVWHLCFLGNSLLMKGCIQLKPCRSTHLHVTDYALWP
jgi:hypothetical protein